MKKLLILSFTLFVLLFSTKTFAQQPITKMHSLYIYNFIKNIRWNNVGDTYIVGVFADATTTEVIKTTIGSRTFNNKKIEVKKIASATEAANCHIVFVSAPQKGSIKQLAAPNILKNTLIVSEEGGVGEGVSIAFLLDNSKLKFKINEPVCKSSGLQISATLLSLSQ